MPTSKDGVIVLVKAAGQELLTHGVLITGFAPAVIRTSMVEAMVPAVVGMMEAKTTHDPCGTLEEAVQVVPPAIAPQFA